MRNIIIIIVLFLGLSCAAQQKWAFNTIEDVYTTQVIRVNGEFTAYDNGNLQVCINSDCIVLTKISIETSYFEDSIIVYNAVYKDVEGVYVYIKLVPDIESVLIEVPSLNYKFWHYNE